jgi:hypothetical protein
MFALTIAEFFMAMGGAGAFGLLVGIAISSAYD